MSSKTRYQACVNQSPFGGGSQCDAPRRLACCEGRRRFPGHQLSLRALSQVRRGAEYEALFKKYHDAWEEPGARSYFVCGLVRGETTE